MKRKDVICKQCGQRGHLHGSDHTNKYGPWHVACIGCGEETYTWAISRMAWKNWSLMNGGN